LTGKKAKADNILHLFTFYVLCESKKYFDLKPVAGSINVML